MLCHSQVSLAHQATRLTYCSCRGLVGASAPVHVLAALQCQILTGRWRWNHNLCLLQLLNDKKMAPAMQLAS